MPPIKETEAAIKRETPLVIIKDLLREVQLYLFTVNCRINCPMQENNWKNSEQVRCVTSVIC